MSRKLIYITVLIAGFFKLNAQFVEIEINIPAGSSIRQGIPAAANSKGQAGSQSGLQWMGISVQENLEMTVVLSFDKDTKGEAYYLNSGSTDLANAVPVTGGRAVFPVNSSGKLLNSSGEGKGFTFWIGLPAGKGMLGMEYN